MTLIATFMRDGMPFVLADVLATSFGGPVTHKPLPTFGHVSEVLTEDIGYSISDLVQKAYIATDNLCIAVAGNYFGCKAATESIFEAYRGNNADFADFKDLGKLGVDVLGWIYDRGKLVGFRWDSKRRTEVEIDNFFVAGTGSEFFEDFLKRDSEYEFVQAPNAALFDADPTLKPRMRALLDVGDLMPNTAASIRWRSSSYLFRWQQVSIPRELCHPVLQWKDRRAWRMGVRDRRAVFAFFVRRRSIGHTAH
jgi:hypothetical protein